MPSEISTTRLLWILALLCMGWAFLRICGSGTFGFTKREASCLFLWWMWSKASFPWSLLPTNSENTSCRTWPRGQRCSIIQYVVKLKTETQCEYLFVILESLLLFPVSDVGNKDWRPAWRGAVRRERRDRERGGVYMPLSIALIADAIQTNGSISHPFPRGRWLWGASKSKWISKAIFSIIY